MILFKIKSIQNCLLIVISVNAEIYIYIYIKSRMQSHKCCLKTYNLFLFFNLGFI